MNDYIDRLRGRIGQDTILLAGAGVFVYRGGKLLLQHRRDDGTWADHGGCMEIGETFEQTARREMEEETGLTAGTLTFLGIYSGPDRIHTYPNGDRVYFVSVYYLCEDFSGTQRLQADELTELRWFPVDALPANIIHLAQKPLEDCLELLRSR